MPKPQCFVIQPFNEDNNHLFKDTIKPAIERAGLKAYRVDQDPSVQVPIESIEEKIRESAVCLADITENNPNVWYEVGYARAMMRRLVLICSTARKSFPFDIQHRQIERYGLSPTGYKKLGRAITKRCLALMEEGGVELAYSGSIDLPQEVGDSEEIVLRTVADFEAPGQIVPLYSLMNAPQVEQLPRADLHLELWRLQKKSYLATGEEVNPMNLDAPPEAWVKITDAGWLWLSQHPLSQQRSEDDRAQWPFEHEEPPEDPPEEPPERPPLSEEEMGGQDAPTEDDDDRVPF